MLSVTAPALEQLHSSLLSSTDYSKCFRIVPKDESTLTLEYMEFEDSDTTFEMKGRTVLALPEVLAPQCKNKNLDIGSDGALELA
jgi:hypothetical protein